jgi:hypothetical protein
VLLVIYLLRWLDIPRVATLFSAVPAVIKALRRGKNYSRSPDPKSHKMCQLGVEFRNHSRFSEESPPLLLSNPPHHSTVAAKILHRICAVYSRTTHSCKACDPSNTVISLLPKDGRKKRRYRSPVPLEGFEFVSSATSYLCCYIRTKPQTGLTSHLNSESYSFLVSDTITGFFYYLVQGNMERALNC